MKKVRRFVQLLLVLSAFLLTSATWAQSTLLTQSWENGGAVPTGWQSTVVSGTNILSFVTTSSYPAGFTGFDGSYFVKFNSWTTNSGVIRLAMTTPIATTNYSTVKVDFAWLESSAYGTSNDIVDVQYSTNGTTWTTAGTFPRYNAVEGWKTKTCNLPAAANNVAALYVAFRFTSAYGNDCYLDLMHITAVGAGTVSGTITNSYNSAKIAGATITIPGGFTATSNAVGVYTIASVPAMAQQITCTATGFLSQTKNITVGVGTTSTVNYAMDPIPATLQGVVTNAANGNPLEGVKVTAGTNVTYTIANGSYVLSVYPGGSVTPNFSKAGFDVLTGTAVTLTPPAVVTQNAALFETTSPTGPVVAALNGASTAVNINWGVPTNNYTIIYDDGKGENLTLWATQGNMNAVKFTPIAYPAKVVGAQVNIGSAAENAATFPTGNHLVPFQFAVYDATGAGGTPGAMIGGPFDVATVTFGFNELMFPTPVTINSGNFYVVMIQGGNAPNAAAIAVDTTTQLLRSYAKFVTGGAPWIAANGNFMMRAIVNGTGGPLFMSPGNNNNNIITASAVPGALYAITPGTVSGVEGTGKYVPYGPQNTESLLGYQVWRLKQGEEATPAVWTSIGTPTTNSMVDNGWPSLACGPYKWAVKAQYTGNRWSGATFSNIVQKCWTAAVTVNVDLSCDSARTAGTVITLKNTVYTDTVYTHILTPQTLNGTWTFPTVWKGTYTLTVSKFGYTSFVQTPITIMGDMTFNVNLLQNKLPPTGLTVNNRTLFSTWFPPVEAQTLFTENFASGSFATNGWVADAGSNWAISTGIGNAAPSAMFNWTPAVTNYSQSLTSKTIQGVYSPTLTLQYDYYLDNYGTTTVNQMAVEIWDGATWHSLKNYTNQGGSIAWTTEQNVDISAYSNGTFKIRFRAYGDDTNDINNWNIDNVKITAKGVTTGPNYCILGYNFYLNNVLSAFTHDTFYQIPPNQVHYGTVYNACVLAIYGSGYSTKSCYTFTSKFLYPPTNIAAVQVGQDDAAYITWSKPTTGDDDHMADAAYRVPITDQQPAAEFATGVAPGQAPQGSAPMSATDIVLYDNGTIINSPGTGAGGADESVVQGALGLTTFGFGQQQTAGISDADDFVVPTGSGWDATKFTFFGYQTGSGNTSTFTGCYFRVWSGSPMAGGTVVYGDLTTNRMTATSWSNIYRTTTVAGTTDRPVMKIECTIPAHHFAPGHYWVEFQSTGSGASGPWCPPITVNGQTNTGDAIQNTGTWAALADGTFPQGLPFQITGTGGGTPDGLIGYNIYRGDSPATATTFIWNTVGADSLYHYDLHLLPGHYCYNVSAKYDLGFYGFPGQTDESLYAPNGPACVDIFYGHPLPFVEPWTNGTFGFNGWTFFPSQGNWSINTGIGNTAPSADFSWQPMVNNYDQSLISPILNGAPITCAKVWMDFDYKLEDRNHTGAEKIDVDVFYNGTWHNKGELVNNGSVDWTAQHIDVSSVAGKGFRVRFRAMGAHSNDILHWYIDNINIYGVCKPVTNLVADAQASDVHLSWTAPKCAVATGNILNEGFESGLFPPQFFTQTIVNTTAANTTWSQSDATALWGVHTGAGSAGLTWDYAHQDEWLIAHNILVTGNLNFWSYAFQGSVNLDHYYVKVSTDNGATWNSVFDLSAMSAYPSSDGWNKWTTPYNVDMAAYSGQAVDIAWQAVDGDGLGLWYVWAIDDLTMGAKKIDISSLQVVSNPYPNQFANSKTSGLSLTELSKVARTGIVHTISYDKLHGAPNAPEAVLGYDIYRMDSLVPFHKINSGIVTDTTYIDPNLIDLYHTYWYYVTALYPSDQCSFAENSDTVSVRVYTGINNIDKGSISIYPNPASDRVTISANSNINSIEVLNYLGQVVYTNAAVNNKKIQVTVAGFEEGVYFVKVTTAEGIRTSKITVTR